jgi:hemolysin D
MRGKTRPVPTGATNTKVSDDYSDFLPAALEIIEKPASPIRYALMWFVCIVAASALIWSFIGRIDVVATAQGKVQPPLSQRLPGSAVSDHRKRCGGCSCAGWESGRKNGRKGFEADCGCS